MVAQHARRRGTRDFSGRSGPHRPRQEVRGAIWRDKHPPLGRAIVASLRRIAAIFPTDGGKCWPCMRGRATSRLIGGVFAQSALGQTSFAKKEGTRRGPDPRFNRLRPNIPWDGYGAGPGTELSIKPAGGLASAEGGGGGLRLATEMGLSPDPDVQADVRRRGRPATRHWTMTFGGGRAWDFRILSAAWAGIIWAAHMFGPINGGDPGPTMPGKKGAWWGDNPPYPRARSFVLADEITRVQRFDWTVGNGHFTSSKGRAFMPRFV